MEEARLLTPQDTPALVELCHAAGWNQTEEDWLRLLLLEPHGCLGIQVEGRLAATATAVCYGRDLAWVGMVLTHADFRGHGLGTRVTSSAVRYARDCGVAVVKLDATDMGRPIYLRLGFRDECPIERWSREPGRVPDLGDPHVPIRPREAVGRLDRLAFGADRSRLLESAGWDGLTTDGGFVAARSGSRALHLGPCVARSESVARALVCALLLRNADTQAIWDLLPENTAAAHLARELGFAPVRRLTRMALSTGDTQSRLAHDDSLVYATAGFEFG